MSRFYAYTFDRQFRHDVVVVDDDVIIKLLQVSLN